MIDGAFWKSFAKMLGYCLICGVVGPAFLVLYAILDTRQSWMLWLGVLITVGVVILAFCITLATSRTQRLMEVLSAHGTPAIGRIVGMRETGTEINGRRVVFFDLRVAGPRVPEFSTTLKTPLPTTAMGAVAKGMLGLFVGDDRKVTIDWKATGLYTGQMPAQFHSTAHDHTVDLTGQADYLLRIVDVLRRHGIALGPTLDIRSDPEVRTEVQAIVDEYAQSQRFAPQEKQAPRSERSVADRLASLDQLLADSQISQSEYDQLRARVLGAI